jgi:hypothetical protein
VIMLEGEGKAVTAVAQTTGKVIDASQALGSFVAKILGTALEDAVGLLGGDWVSHMRSRNAHRLQQRTDEILGQRQAEIKPLSLSVAKPLIEAAQDESRDELVEMWARLLANALDKSRPPIRRAFIEALKRLDSLDVLILERTYKDDRHSWVDHDHWPESFNVTADEFHVSITHLVDIGCIAYDKRVHISGRPDIPSHILLPFGRELLRACSE